MCAEFTSPLPCVTLALGNGNGNYLQNGGVTLWEGGRQGGRLGGWQGGSMEEERNCLVFLLSHEIVSCDLAIRLRAKRF